MRILQTIAARDWGGIAYRTTEQALWLNRNGHECWLASPADSEVAKRAAAAGVPVVPMDFDRPFSPATIGKLRRCVARLSCDIVECHTGRCANAAMFVRDRCAILRARHTTQPLKANWRRRLRWRFAWDWTVVTADVIARQLTAQRLVPEDRLSVVGEWADDRFFDRTQWSAKRSEWRRQFGADPAAFVVGAVGMLRPEKGFDILIRAVATIAAARAGVMAIIVGEPTGGSAYGAGLKSLAEELGVARNVRFIGYHDDIPGLLQAFDVLAVPSTFEAQSRTVPEALASARAVVASDVGGIGELIRPGDNGWLVPPNDPAALADRLLSVWNDPDSAARVSRQAGEKARNSLTIDRKMAEYLAVYELALRRRHRRTPEDTFEPSTAPSQNP